METAGRRRIGRCSCCPSGPSRLLPPPEAVVLSTRKFVTFTCAAASSACRCALSSASSAHTPPSLLLSPPSSSPLLPLLFFFFAEWWLVALGIKKRQLLRQQYSVTIATNVMPSSGRIEATAEEASKISGGTPLASSRCVAATSSASSMRLLRMPQPERMADTIKRYLATSVGSVCVTSALTTSAEPMAVKKRSTISAWGVIIPPLPLLPPTLPVAWRSVSTDVSVGDCCCCARLLLLPRTSTLERKDVVLPCSCSRDGTWL